jgi:hypothetical protein
LNTPAHLLVNLAVLGGGPRRAHAGAIALGALLPDLPMFGFYVWQKLMLAAPERTIWGSAYFEPSWQLFFDLFNSIPLAAAGLGVALVLRRTDSALFCASVIAHTLLDLPFHREDAHRHFLPLSSWQFVSPLSYWDPAHCGAAVAFVETLLLCGSAALLWRRYEQPWVRICVALLATLSAAAWSLFYGAGWLPELPQ